MINLKKGDTPVSLAKSETIDIVVSWPAATDYDLGAEILYADGSTESLAAFSAVGLPLKMRSRSGAVVHHGDTGRGEGTATETITVDVSKSGDIVTIAPWAYSAQSNGTGSFRRYSVSMAIYGKSDKVQIDAVNASGNERIYTCVPGLIHFRDGVATVEYDERYSATGSESRPQFRARGVMRRTVELRMDGPRNAYK